MGAIMRTDIELAKANGFSFALTLDPEPSDTAKPMALSRYCRPTIRNSPIIVRNLLFEDPLPSARRLVALDPARAVDG